MTGSNLGEQVTLLMRRHDTRLALNALLLWRGHVTRHMRREELVTAMRRLVAVASAKRALSAWASWAAATTTVRRSAGVSALMGWAKWTAARCARRRRAATVATRFRQRRARGQLRYWQLVAVERKAGRHRRRTLLLKAMYVRIVRGGKARGTTDLVTGRVGERVR
jgi:hypothetical protein